MPCYEPPMVEKEEAFLCGITDALRKMNLLIPVLDNVIWENVGLNIDDFDRWIKKHDKRDQARKYGDVK